MSSQSHSQSQMCLHLSHPFASRVSTSPRSHVLLHFHSETNRDSSPSLVHPTVVSPNSCKGKHVSSSPSIQYMFMSRSRSGYHMPATVACTGTSLSAAERCIYGTARQRAFDLQPSKRAHDSFLTSDFRFPTAKARKSDSPGRIHLLRLGLRSPLRVLGFAA